MLSHGYLPSLKAPQLRLIFFGEGRHGETEDCCDPVHLLCNTGIRSFFASPVPATGPQGTGATPVKQASLADLPTAIQSLGISDEGPGIRGWVPRDQQHVIARVLAWLKTAAPYEEKIPPQPTTLIIGDYVGSSHLHLTTTDHGQLDIYPAYYYNRMLHLVEACCTGRNASTMPLPRKQ